MIEPAAFRDHVRGGVFDGEKRADQIDLQNLQPILHGLLEERRRNEAAADPGIGINNVEPAKGA